MEKQWTVVNTMAYIIAIKASEQLGILRASKIRYYVDYFSTGEHHRS